ncbi:MAG: ROK family protein [Deltaproteobacteria bacterium]|nr:ROK family protein [Deltaproteobacteria bacterium]
MTQSVDDYVIGVDIGGTNLKIGALLPNGEVLCKMTTPSQVHEGRDSVIKRILSAIEEVKCRAGELDLAGVGIGIAGAVNQRDGMVVQAPNLPGWEGFRVVEELSEVLSCPIVIDNDANVFTLGEGWRGAARESRNFCCLTLGTGVGGGLVLDGRLWYGVDGTAGEVGHIVVEPDGIQCDCGSRGCLEMYASATALVRMAREKGEGEGITADEIARRARGGDEQCRHLFFSLARYLGIAMTDLVNLLNLDMIVLGGGLSVSCDLFLDEARKEMLDRSFTVPGERVKVLPAELSSEGGMIGAAFLALQRAEMSGLDN